MDAMKVDTTAPNARAVVRPQCRRASGSALAGHVARWKVPTTMRFDRRRVTIMGLGHFGGGVSVTRWLVRHGAAVTITDLAGHHRLAEAMAALTDTPMEAVHLGGHREKDFLDADLVVVNPAVRPGNHFLRVAQSAGVPLTTEIELFLENCPATVIGVTGANGKSTTAAMIAAILEADGRRVWLGGNLGGSLLDELEHMGVADWVIVELSSFQLDRLAAQTPRPHVAVVTNCTPNHLDWHGDLGRYVAAKQQLLVGQTADDVVVLGESLAEDLSWQQAVRGQRAMLIAEGEIPPLAVPGKHNRRNAVYAATAARAVGCDAMAICSGLSSFTGLPGRLQTMATIADRTFLNDTTATTPESTMAALESLDRPMWLLAGGSDKGIDLAPLVSVAITRAQGAAFFGATASTLNRLAKGMAPEFPCVETSTMSYALDWCWSRSRSGDCIVLSPGCASHDQYQNFQQRGAQFCELVERLDRGDVD